MSSEHEYNEINWSLSVHPSSNVTERWLARAKRKIIVTSKVSVSLGSITDVYLQDLFLVSCSCISYQALSTALQSYNARLSQGHFRPWQQNMMKLIRSVMHHNGLDQSKSERDEQTTSANMALGFHYRCSQAHRAHKFMYYHKRSFGAGRGCNVTRENHIESSRKPINLTQVSRKIQWRCYSECYLKLQTQSMNDRFAIVAQERSCSTKDRWNQRLTTDNK